MKMKDWSPDRIAKLSAVAVKRTQARLARARIGLTIVEGAEDSCNKLIVYNLAHLQGFDVRRIIRDLSLILIRKTYHAHRLPVKDL